MDGRRPPPSYEETLGRGEEALMGSPYNSNTTGRSNGGGAGQGVPYNSNKSGGSPAVGGARRASGSRGSPSAAASDIRQSLHGTGFKVVYYPPQKGKPEERMAWMNKHETEFALLKNVKSSVKNFMGKKIVHPLADLQTVTLGVPASEMYATRSFASSPGGQAGRQAGRPWRLSEHSPDPRLTIRLRFVKGTVDIEGCTANESMALHAILSQYTPAGQEADRDTPFASTGRPATTPRRHDGGGGGLGGGGARQARGSTPSGGNPFDQE